MASSERQDDSVRGIAAAFDWHEVRSPSFTLINEYPTDPPIAHIDLYRLKESELAEMGIEEYIDSGYLVIIEWASPTIFPLQQSGGMS